MNNNSQRLFVRKLWEQGNCGKTSAHGTKRFSRTKENDLIFFYAPSTSTSTDIHTTQVIITGKIPERKHTCQSIPSIGVCNALRIKRYRSPIIYPVPIENAWIDKSIQPSTKTMQAPLAPPPPQKKKNNERVRQRIKNGMGL